MTFVSAPAGVALLDLIRTTPRLTTLKVFQGLINRKTVGLIGFVFASRLFEQCCGFLFPAPIYPNFRIRFRLRPGIRASKKVLTFFGKFKYDKCSKTMKTQLKEVCDSRITILAYACWLNFPDPGGFSSCWSKDSTPIGKAFCQNIP